jgi:phage repressor protein C with HTH and peptisase S24 domain
MDYREWLRAGLKKPGKRIQELADRLGKHRSFVDKILSGDRKRLSTEELRTIAEYIEEDMPMNGTGLGKTSSVVEASTLKMAPVEIEGVVEAGAFREAEMLAQSSGRLIEAPKDTKYPFATQRAFEVHGDSMNELIADGAIVFGVDFVRSGAALANGNLVVVERTRDGLIERSLKEVRILQDQIEFRPRSTNPIHESFRVPRHWAGDHFAPNYKILAIIRGAIQTFN